MTANWGNGLSETLLSRLQELDRLRRRGKETEPRLRLAVLSLKLVIQRRQWVGFHHLQVHTVPDIQATSISKTRCSHCGSRSLQAWNPVSASSLLLLLPSESRPKSPIAVSNTSDLSAIPFESFQTHWVDRSTLMLDSPAQQAVIRLKHVLRNHFKPVWDGLEETLWTGFRTGSSSSLDDG